MSLRHALWVVHSVGLLLQCAGQVTPSPWVSPDDDQESDTVPVVLGVTIGFFIVMAILLWCYYYRRKRKARNERPAEPPLNTAPPGDHSLVPMLLNANCADDSGSLQTYATYVEDSPALTLTVSPPIEVAVSPPVDCIQADDNPLLLSVSDVPCSPMQLCSSSNFATAMRFAVGDRVISLAGQQQLPGRVVAVGQNTYEVLLDDGTLLRHHQPGLLREGRPRYAVGSRVSVRDPVTGTSTIGFVEVASGSRYTVRFGGSVKRNVPEECMSHARRFGQGDAVYWLHGTARDSAVVTRCNDDGSYVILIGTRRHPKTVRAVQLEPRQDYEFSIGSKVYARSAGSNSPARAGVIVRITASGLYVVSFDDDGSTTEVEARWLLPRDTSHGMLSDLLDEGDSQPRIRRSRARALSRTISTPLTHTTPLTHAACNPLSSPSTRTTPGRVKGRCSFAYTSL